jgi:hypothetical protein
MSEPDDLPDPAVNAAPEAETALQRALRLKKASIEARPKAPRGGRFQREQAARVATGKSKPWMGR